MKFNHRILAALVSVSIVPQMSFAQELGKGGGAISGAAGPEGGGGTVQLERCDRKFGTLAVVEPQDFVQKTLSQYALPSPTQMIRLIVQQSGCFAVVERGLGMQNVMQERALAEGGQLRGNQNVGRSQMVTADYIMTPDVNFKNSNAGGVGGLVGGLFGPVGAIIGGALKFKTAQVSLTMADTRSSLQVGASTGSSEATDFAIGGALGGGGAGGAFGAYENTAEGKVVAAAFLDAYNKLVQSLRSNPELTRTNASLRVASAGAQQNANASSGGDIGMAKIGNVPVYETNAKKKIAFKLPKGEQIVILSEEAGLLEIQGANGSGWVDARLISR